MYGNVVGEIIIYILMLQLCESTPEKKYTQHAMLQKVNDQSRQKKNINELDSFCKQGGESELKGWAARFKDVSIATKTSVIKEEKDSEETEQREW